MDQIFFVGTFNYLGVKQLKLMYKQIWIIVFFLAFGLFSCANNGAEAQNDQEQEQIANDPTFEMLWSTDTVFKIPESTLYDSERKVIYVSNVNQNPRQKDNNGFISRMNKDGKDIELEWVSGLSSPKGMGLKDTILYVTDVDEMVAININSAEIIKKYPLADVGMLNDISIAPNGTVYVTDMDSSRILVLEDEELILWQDGLNRPNGIYAEDDRILIASNGDGKFLAYDLTSKAMTELGAGFGRSDGIVKTALGKYVVSDWSGEIFLVDGNNIQSLFSSKAQEIQTADIGLIPDENTILVPTFFDNRVAAYKLN